MLLKGSDIVPVMWPPGFHMAMSQSATTRSIVWRVDQLEVRTPSWDNTPYDELSRQQVEWALSRLAPTTLIYYLELDIVGVDSKLYAELWHAVEGSLVLARLQHISYCSVYLPAFLHPPLLCVTRARNTLTSIRLPDPHGCRLEWADLPDFPHLTDVGGVVLHASKGNCDFAFAVLRRVPKLRKLSLRVYINPVGTDVVARRLAELCDIVGTRLYELKVQYDIDYGSGYDSPVLPPYYTPDFRDFISVRKFGIFEYSGFGGWDLALLPPHLEQLVVPHDKGIYPVPLAAQFVEALSDDKWQEGLRALAIDVNETDTSPSEWAELQGLCERRDLEECDLVLHERHRLNPTESRWPIPPGTQRAYRHCGVWQRSSKKEEEEEET